MAIVKLAKEHGHSVIFTPQLFNDLQPIELAWALVKGAVVRVVQAWSVNLIICSKTRELKPLVESSTPSMRQTAIIHE